MPTYDPIDRLKKFALEDTSGLLTGTMVDEQNLPPILTGVAVLIYDKDTGQTIRSVTNALNANGGTYDPGTGAFAFQILSSDHALLNPASLVETRVALVTWTYGASSKGRQMVEWRVQGSEKIP